MNVGECLERVELVVTLDFDEVNLVYVAFICA